MPGGLLNLVANGNLNLILNGNPSKTFFKTTYSKYTNFGLQKFRINYIGNRFLSINEDTQFTFEFDNIGDLLLDTYLVVQLPNIFSPVIEYPQLGDYIPYEFKWIENLGAQMIRTVKFMIDGQTIQEFTGQYLYNMVQRDFTEEKKRLFSEMIGNTVELTDPKNYNSRDGRYPNVYYDSNITNSDNISPSILARKLYIPLNIWSTLSSKMAIPLLCLQYSKFKIEVNIRPVSELFVVKDVLATTTEDRDKYIAQQQNNAAFQFYRFVNTPTAVGLDGTDSDANKFNSTRTDWRQDIHLICTSAFLNEEEQNVFKFKPQQYLIKEIHEETYYNTTGTQTIRINSHGLVASWMWYFQRDDVKLRNEWSNYTNWPYNTIPESESGLDEIDPLLPVPIYKTKKYNPINEKNILMKMSILLDGKLRENEFDFGVYSYIEKYIKTGGYSNEHLYCYNFCLDTDPFKLQPSGAINLSKFKHIEFRVNTLLPEPDPNSIVYSTTCTPDGLVIPAQISDINIKYKYNYNLHIMEERYNILTFKDGMSYLLAVR